MEVAGPLGTPLGLAQRKRASPQGQAGTSGFLCVSDSDPLAVQGTLKSLLQHHHSKAYSLKYLKFSRRRRGRQRMRWLDGITDSMDVSLSELRVSSCSGGLRPSVELCVEPAGLCGRCTGVAVPLRATRLEALVPSRDSRARTRSPSPRAWRPDFPGAAREAP